jgi:uncharacterized membrane protein
MAVPNQVDTDAHWRATTRLMLTHLGIWFFFGYVVHIFVFAKQQDKIDRDFGVAEDE